MTSTNNCGNDHLIESQECEARNKKVNTQSTTSSNINQWSNVEILDFLDKLNYNILYEKNLTVEELKKLLLIIYNEMVLDYSDITVKSFLVVTLNHFINLETEYLNNYANHKINSHDLLNKLALNKLRALIPHGKE